MYLHMNIIYTQSHRRYVVTSRKPTRYRCYIERVPYHMIVVESLCTRSSIVHKRRGFDENPHFEGEILVEPAAFVALGHRNSIVTAGRRASGVFRLLVLSAA